MKAGLMGLALLVVASPAWAGGEQRNGLTVGLGAGITHGSVGLGGIGVAPLAAGVGWFITPSWSVGARTLHSGVPQDELGESRWYSTRAYLVTLSHWTDELVYSIGFGAQFLGPGFFTLEPDGPVDVDPGPVLSLRLGRRLLEHAHGELHVSWELLAGAYVTPAFPGLTPSEAGFGTTYEPTLLSQLLVEWQVW